MSLEIYCMFSWWPRGCSSVAWILSLLHQDACAIVCMFTMLLELLFEVMWNSCFPFLFYALSGSFYLIVYYIHETVSSYSPSATFLFFFLSIGASVWQWIFSKLCIIHNLRRRQIQYIYISRLVLQYMQGEIVCFNTSYSNTELVSLTSYSCFCEHIEMHICWQACVTCVQQFDWCRFTLCTYCL